jgi:hypothetical protein
MTVQPPQPQLHVVDHPQTPPVEVLDPAQAQAQVPQALQAQQPGIEPQPSLQQPQVFVQDDSMNQLMPHIMALAVIGGAGATAGGLAAQSWRGAGIGAGINLALLGILRAVFGVRSGIPSQVRMMYGVAGLAGGVLAGYLSYTR